MEKSACACIRKSYSKTYTSLVNESLPLAGEVSVAGGDAKEEGIVLLEVVDILNDGIGGLGGSVHEAEDLVGESLGDLEDGGLAAGSLDTALLGLGELGNVPVHGVDDDSDLSHCEECCLVGWWGGRLRVMGLLVWV